MGVNTAGNKGNAANTNPISFFKKICQPEEYRRAIWLFKKYKPDRHSKNALTTEMHTNHLIIKKYKFDRY